MQVTLPTHPWAVSIVPLKCSCTQQLCCGWASFVMTRAMHIKPGVTPSLCDGQLPTTLMACCQHHK
jgi:hypothetical protein